MNARHFRILNVAALWTVVVWQTFVNELHAVDFATEVMPVLTRHGCNAGACHGAALGRGGFHLSLLGSDPTADYETIVHAFEGRRVNRANPVQSLLVRKATGELSHGGDDALPVTSHGYKLVLDWLRDDLPRPAARTLTGFRTSPSHVTLKNSESQFTLKSEACFDGGSWEDVTHLTHFVVTDPESISWDSDSASGEIKRPGQHVILARYLQRIEPVLMVRSFDERPVKSDDQPAANLIDQEINQSLSHLGIAAASEIDDTSFLRRVTIDLTGRLPSLEQQTNFLSWPPMDRRQRLVDRLLASKAFVDYWTLNYSKLLRVHALPNEPQALIAYTQWLRESVATGRPWNDMVRQLLLATGDSHINGPSNFSRMIGDARAHAELVGDVMLGVKLGCANCHDHPLDRWTQDDYHGLAAIFARIDRGRTVQWLSRGEVTNPRTKTPARPRIPGQRFIDADEDALTLLSNWIDDPTQSTMARAHVNRLWQAMFGRGLIEPADDLRDTNPASHAQLLNQLSDNLVAHQYDLRQTLRLIVNSRTYSKVSTSEGDRFYGSVNAKPLLPEVLEDAFADVTDVPGRFEGYTHGTRAVEIWNTRLPSAALDILGRCTRTDVCTETRSGERSLATQLHLLNGELINRRLIDPAGRLSRLILSETTNAAIVDEFYRRALTRPPTSTESAAWQLRLDALSGPERRMQLEDFLWSLLCNSQFQRNQ